MKSVRKEILAILDAGKTPAGAIRIFLAGLRREGLAIHELHDELRAVGLVMIGENEPPSKKP